jgi:UDP-N-acetylglucosamine acyltransferase
MVQGGSKVGKDVPPFSMAGRDPLGYCGINSVGLRRRNFTDKQIHTIQDVYRHIYMSGRNVSDALKQIREEMPPSKERDIILDFVENAPRGIIKGYLP